MLKAYRRGVKSLNGKITGVFTPVYFDGGIRNKKLRVGVKNIKTRKKSDGDFWSMQEILSDCLRHAGIEFRVANSIARKLVKLGCKIKCGEVVVGNLTVCRFISRRFKVLDDRQLNLFQRTLGWFMCETNTKKGVRVHIPKLSIIRGKKCVDYYKNTNIASCMTGKRAKYHSAIFKNKNVFMVIGESTRCKCYINYDGSVTIDRVYGDYRQIAIFNELQKKYEISPSAFCYLKHKEGDFLPYLDYYGCTRLDCDTILIHDDGYHQYTDGFDHTSTKSWIRKRGKNVEGAGVVAYDGIKYDSSECRYIPIGDEMWWVPKRDCVKVTINGCGNYYLKRDMVKLSNRYNNRLWPKQHAVRTYYGEIIKDSDNLVLKHNFHKHDRVIVGKMSYAVSDLCVDYTGQIRLINDTVNIGNLVCYKYKKIKTVDGLAYPQNCEYIYGVGIVKKSCIRGGKHISQSVVIGDKIYAVKDCIFRKRFIPKKGVQFKYVNDPAKNTKASCNVTWKTFDHPFLTEFRSIYNAHYENILAYN